MKKKQAEENGNGTRNGVAGTVTDIVLSSVESEKEVDHKIGSESAVRCDITAMMMSVYTNTKLFQRK
jgi:hypothetical protein